VVLVHDHVLGVAGPVCGEAILVTDGESVAPAPSSSTVPARSLPWPDGNFAGNLSCRTLADPGLAGVDPAATT